MKKRKLLSFVLAFVIIFTNLMDINPTVYAASGDFTGSAGVTINAYPDGVRMNMIPVSGAMDYKVYMSTNSTLTTANVATAACLFSSASYQPYAYFTNGDMDIIATTTAVTISPSTTYFFYYVTNGTTITTKYEAQTQAGGTSWTSPGNYDTSWYTPGSSPYTISTAAQLAGLAYLVNSGTNFSGQTIMLGVSIDVSAYPWTAIGMGSNHFSGTFEGYSNAVNGFNITIPTNGTYHFSFIFVISFNN